MRNIFNLIRFILGILLLITMIYFAVDSMGDKYCKLSEITIEIDENKFVTKEVVIEYLKENTLYPDSILLNNVSFSNMENMLINHPSIKSAEVYSDMSANVFITLTQRKPIVRIQEDKKGYYLDEDGLKMPLSNIFTSRMLLVTGEIHSVKNAELFELSEFIYNNTFWKKQIVQINIEKSKLLMLTKLGEQLEFGQIKDVKEKFENLMLYYEKGNSQNKEYKTLNLEYKNQIVCIKK